MGLCNFGLPRCGFKQIPTSEFSHLAERQPTSPHANLQPSERLKGLRVSFAASKETLISPGIKGLRLVMDIATNPRIRSDSGHLAAEAHPEPTRIRL